MLSVYPIILHFLGVFTGWTLCSTLWQLPTVPALLFTACIASQSLSTNRQTKMWYSCTERGNNYWF